MLVVHSRVPEGIVPKFEEIARRVVLETVMPLAQIKDATDTGCCVALWMRVHDPEPHWVLVCVIAIGDVTAEKFLKYGFLCMEKGLRLSQNDDHIVSFQSRDNEDDPDWTKCKYPGALRMDLAEIIVSTSGFAWTFDELTDHLIGASFRWLERGRCVEALGISQNQDALDVLAVSGIL